MVSLRALVGLVVASTFGCKGVGSWALVRADRDPSVAWATVYQLELAGDLPNTLVPSEPSATPLSFGEPLEFTLSTDERRDDDVTVAATGIGDGGVNVLAGGFVIPWSKGRDAEVTLCLGLPGAVPICPRLGDDGGGAVIECLDDVPILAHTYTLAGEGCVQQYARIEVSCPSCTTNGTELQGTIRLEAEESFVFASITSLPMSFLITMPFRYAGPATLNLVWRDGSTIAGELNTGWEFGVGNPTVEAALFPPAGQTVTVSFTGAGAGTVTSTPAGISCPGTCSAVFAAPAVLSIAPDAGSRFVTWSSCAPSGRLTCNAAPGSAVSVELAALPRAGASARDIAMYDANYGWVVGDSGSTWQTTTGGAMWSEASGAAYALNCVAQQGGTFFAAGAERAIYQWSGISWGLLYSNAFTQPFLDCQIPSWATEPYLVGGDGIFRYVSGSVESIFSGLAFEGMSISGTDLWAVGPSGVIVHATNLQFGPSASFTEQTSNVSTTLRAVDFADTSYGIAVGDGGVILRTLNGGTNWSVMTEGVYPDLREVVFDTIDVFAAGADGTILRSGDAGTTWQRFASGVSAAITGLATIDANTTLAVTEQGALLRVQDLSVEP